MAAATAIVPYEVKLPEPRQQTQREADLVRALLGEFSEMTTWRNTHAAMWEETAQLLWPEHRNTFYYGSFNWPGAKKAQQQIDATGMLALHRFAAICDSMLTPSNSQWHRLVATNPDVMKDRKVALWFDQITALLFKYRRNPLANFRGQNNANFRSLGAFGNATMFVDPFDGRLHGGMRGLRYRGIPIGECFFGENHQGMVDRNFRWLRLPAYQAVQKFGLDRLPTNLHAALQANSQWPFNFLHCVKPRDDYDQERLDARGLPYGSWYVSIEGQCLMADEGGYRTFPYAISRYDQAPREVYGRGPAQMVLPALKTLNAQKATFLKQGHRAADPVLLMADDGIANFSLRPGAQNPGTVTQEGKLLVGVLPTGDIQTNEKMMAMEAKIIEDMFLTSLYETLRDNPNMTATQVTELVNQKGILIAPTLGRQETEYLSPMIERELDVLNAQRLLPPMPPMLAEAQGEYEVVYESALAQMQRAGRAAGFMRVVETSKEVVNITGDQSALDWADFDTALPEIARDQGVLEHWISDKKDIESKRQSRAKAQQQRNQIEALPAQAAMLKAQAVVSKNQPGVGGAGFGGARPA